MEKASQQIRTMSEVGEFDSAELNRLKIIHHGMSNRKVLNTFRDLRTNLMQKVRRKNFSCLVSSVTAKGGGTFVTANLAAAFALDQTKTSLIVDCNLYDSAIDRLLPVSPELGLTDYLIDSSIDIEQILYASGIPRLRVVPLGSHLESAAEFFSSNRMIEFVERIKNRYPDRYIFFDAPPVANSAETRILSDITDMTLLVAPYGKVTQSVMNDAVGAIGQKKLAGIVFNN